MQDPDLRAVGLDPVPLTRFVMHQQIRLQGFNQTRNLRVYQVGVDFCAGELERPTLAGGQDMRVPAVGFIRTPQVEHALTPTNGQVPRHEMDQSWAAVSWPKFCERF